MNHHHGTIVPLGDTDAILPGGPAARWITVRLGFLDLLDRLAEEAREKSSGVEPSPESIIPDKKQANCVRI